MFCEDYRQRSVSLAEGGRWPTFDSREILKKKTEGEGWVQETMIMVSWWVISRRLIALLS